LGEALHPSGVVLEGMHEAVAPEATPVLPQVPSLVLGPALGQGLVGLLLRVALLAVLGREDEVGGLAADFLLGPAHEALGPRVPGGDSSPEVGGEDGVVLGALGEEPEEFGPLMEPFVGIVAGHEASPTEGESESSLREDLTIRLIPPRQGAEPWWCELFVTIDMPGEQFGEAVGDHPGQRLCVLGVRRNDPPGVTFWRRFAR